jgi:O-antigen/teichoic acid export membrane protein
MIKKLKNSVLNNKYGKRKSIRDFAAIVGANVGIRPISIVKSFIVAKYLGPAEYGILKSTELIAMLNKFGNLGFKQVAQREIGVLKGKNLPEREKQIRDTAYTAEVILAIILAISGIIVSLFLSSKWVWVVSIASIGLLVGKVRLLFNTEATIQRKFTLIAKVTFFTGLFVSILIASTVPFLKIYASLGMPILVAMGAIIYYKKTLKFDYSFHIDKEELLHQIRIGIPLTLHSLAYGSYLYLERILIITYLSVTDLGYFGFATMVSNQFITIFLTAIRVRKMNILEYLGRGDYIKVNKLVIKETSILMLGSFGIILLVWAITSIFVPIFLEKYVAAIVIANLFILVLPFKVLSSYLAIVIKSPIVNKQDIVPFYQFAATGLLFIVVVIMHNRGVLTLKSYVIADLIGYAAVHISFVFMYYKYFYLSYCKPNSNDIK